RRGGRRWRTWTGACVVGAVAARVGRRTAAHRRSGGPGPGRARSPAAGPSVRTARAGRPRPHRSDAAGSMFLTGSRARWYSLPMSASRRVVRTFAASAVLALGVAVVTAHPAAAATGTVLPAHVYAPYFEAWTTDSITTLAQQSGARYLTLAFLQTPKKGSCTITWNGSASQTMSAGRYQSDIASLRALGGDVIPSFGGFSADHGGTEIADSCTDVNQIAAAYESVVSTYNVTRLDMDVESNSLNNTAGIDRRNKAINLLESWAAGQGRTVQIQYTLPVEPAGLESNGLAVLQNAVANGTRV